MFEIQDREQKMRIRNEMNGAFDADETAKVQLRAKNVSQGKEKTQSILFSHQFYSIKLEREFPFFSESKSNYGTCVHGGKTAKKFSIRLFRWEFDDEFLKKHFEKYAHNICQQNQLLCGN